MTLWLIAINVTIFLAECIAQLLIGHEGLLPWLALPASFTDVIHRPWTLLTYMVTHESILHILFNMLWLYWFGTMSERSAGARSVLTAYICGGLTGGLTYVSVASLTSLIPVNSQLLGASASVLCIMTATALRTPNLEVQLLLAGPIRLKWFALLCILLAMLGLGGGNSGGVVAHIGGVITGGVIGLRQRGYVQRVKFKARLRMNRGKVRRIQARNSELKPSALTPQQQLDLLLDKIKISGYASLTVAEREELRKLSQNV